MTRALRRDCLWADAPVLDGFLTARRVLIAACGMPVSAATARSGLVTIGNRVNRGEGLLLWF